MFDKMKEFLSDVYNDFQVDMFEKSNLANSAYGPENFDEYFADWTRLSKSCSSGSGYFQYR